MFSIIRTTRAIAALALSCSFAAACAVAAPEEGPTSTGEQAVTSTDGPLPIGVIPVVPRGELCLEDSTCWASDQEPPDTWTLPTYGFYNVRSGWPLDTTLGEQLTALGCTPQRTYSPDQTVFGNEYSISFCPRAPVDPNPTWTVIDRCNSCTGRPPPGWVLVAWTEPASKLQPGGGCNSQKCLVL